jgi:hypothetical protein
MFIINDTGDSIVNSDQVISFAIAHRPDGVFVVAFGAGVQVVLASGTNERAMQCMEAIRKAAKERRILLDLRDEIGQRPDLTIAQNALVIPGNGELKQ